MDISQELNSLIRPRKVCLCNSVSEKDIVTAYQEGATTLTMIIKKTKASTDCGTCLEELTNIMNSLKKREKGKNNPTFFK